MRLIDNTGTNRVIDVLRHSANGGASIAIASPVLSLFAFSAVREILDATTRSRLVLSPDSNECQTFLGSAADRSARNNLQARWLARKCSEWIRTKAEVRASSSPLPQSAYVVEPLDSTRRRVITGNCPLTTDGLGLTPGNQLGLIQCAEAEGEVRLFAVWYESLWNALPGLTRSERAFTEGPSGHSRSPCSIEGLLPSAAPVFQGPRRRA